MASMASAVCTDFEASMVFANRARRSFSLTSHPASPLETPPFPGTPTTTPANISPAGTATTTPFRNPSNFTSSANSPPLASASPAALPVPMNTPASNLDSGISSPSEAKAPKPHLPILLEARHFPSPLLSPSVPPNSPESWPFKMDSLNDSNDVPEDMSATLGERLAALAVATSKKDGFTNEEVQVLNEAVSKSSDNEFYEVLAVPGKGYGCFAKKPLRRGTRILTDSPLLVVPMHEYYQPDIQAAFDKLSPTDQALYFTLHSAHGQDPAQWPTTIHESVSKRERARIIEQHNARVGKEPSLISIFQTNCMEMGSGAAVFPNASRFNHSCNPNACFSWNKAIHKEAIHIINNVQKGEQITLSYCDMTHDKMLRRWELKHYGFICDCPACGDDDDLESFASKSAARRYAINDMQAELRPFRGSNLEQGIKKENFIGELMKLAWLHIQEGDYTERVANIFLDIALIAEQTGYFKDAQTAARRALEVKRDYQGSDFPDYGKYKAVVDRITERIKGEAQATAAGGQ